jgi:hypothetical protein
MPSLKQSTRPPFSAAPVSTHLGCMVRPRPTLTVIRSWWWCVDTGNEVYTSAEHLPHTK